MGGLIPSLFRILWLVMFVSSADGLDCENLTYQEMKNASNIVKECLNSTSLGTEVDPAVLDISSLNDKQFNDLFEHKITLNIGLAAQNSKLSNMTFPRLENFYVSAIILYLVDNRLLRTLSFPALREHSLQLKDFPTKMPVYILHNPVLPYNSIFSLTKVIGLEVSWDDEEAKDSYGACQFTQPIRNLKDLDNCRTVKRHLVIDNAIGTTRARILNVEGYISITNSMIKNADFLIAQHDRDPSEEYGKDVIKSNPNLCLTQRQWDIFAKRYGHLEYANNKPKSFCEHPTTTCRGGSLHDSKLRDVIETGRCETIEGNLVIDNFIDMGSQLHVKLSNGLAAIRTIRGSLILTSNDGLKSLDVLPNLKHIYPRNDSCEPALAVWVNFNLRRLDLGNIIIHPTSIPNCPLISIGGNGEEGLETLLPESSNNELKASYVNATVSYENPRSPESVRREIESRERLRLALIVCCSFAACMFFIVLFLFIVKSKKAVKEGRAAQQRGEEETLLTAIEPAKSVVNIERPVVNI